MKTNERRFQVTVHYKANDNGIIADGMNETNTATAEQAANWIIAFAEENSNYTVTEFSIRDCETFKKYRSNDADLQALVRENVETKAEVKTIETKIAKNGSLIIKVDGKRTSKAVAMEIAANNERQIMSSLFEQANTDNVKACVTVNFNTTLGEALIDNFYFDAIDAAIDAASKIIATFADRIISIRVSDNGDWNNCKIFAASDNGNPLTVYNITEADPDDYAVTEDALEVAVNAEIQLANNEIKPNTTPEVDLITKERQDARNEYYELNHVRKVIENDVEKFERLRDRCKANSPKHKEYNQLLESFDPIIRAFGDKFISAQDRYNQSLTLRTDEERAATQKAIDEHNADLDARGIKYFATVYYYPNGIEGEDMSAFEKECTSLDEANAFVSQEEHDGVYVGGIYDAGWEIHDRNHNLIADHNTGFKEEQPMTDELIISTKENADGKITAYYINGERVRKCDIEYYACNHSGIIKIDYHLAQNFHALKYPGDQRKVVYTDYYGQTLMSKAAADELGYKIVKNNSLEIFYVEPNPTDTDDGSNDEEPALIVETKRTKRDSINLKLNGKRISLRNLEDQVENSSYFSVINQYGKEYSCYPATTYGYFGESPEGYNLHFNTLGELIEHYAVDNISRNAKVFPEEITGSEAEVARVEKLLGELPKDPNEGNPTLARYITSATATKLGSISWAIRSTDFNRAEKALEIYKSALATRANEYDFAIELAPKVIGTGDLIPVYYAAELDGSEEDNDCYNIFNLLPNLDELNDLSETDPYFMDDDAEYTERDATQQLDKKKEKTIITGRRWLVWQLWETLLTRCKSVGLTITNRFRVAFRVLTMTLRKLATALRRWVLTLRFLGNSHKA